MRHTSLVLTALVFAASAIPAHAQNPGGGRMFAKIDANSDGQLDESEVAALLKKRAERRGATAPDAAAVAAFIKRLDSDGNGTVSQAEMKAGAARRGAHKKGVGAPAVPESE